MSALMGKCPDGLDLEVCLAATTSPTGMGVRKLTWQELGLLWDIPILIFDSVTSEQHIVLMGTFCTSAPAKVLFACTDALLTTLFRGGGGE